MAEWAFSAKESLSSSYGRTANATIAAIPRGILWGNGLRRGRELALAGLGTDTGNSIRGPRAPGLVGFGPPSASFPGRALCPCCSIGTWRPHGALRSRRGGPMNVIAADPADRPPLRPMSGARGLRQLSPCKAPGARLGVLRAFVPRETDPEVRALSRRRWGICALLGQRLLIPGDSQFEQHLAGGASQSLPHGRGGLSRRSRGRQPWRDVATPCGLRGASSERGPLATCVSAPPSAWDPPCPGFADHPERQAFLAAVTGALDAAKVEPKPIRVGLRAGVPKRRRRGIHRG